MKIKLFFITLVCGIVSIFGVSQASALETDYKWNEIYNQFYENVKQDGVTVNKTDDAVNISLTNPTYGEYSMEMTYENNVLSYNNIRDVSSANDETKMYYARNDSYFFYLMAYAMLETYKIDPTLVDGDMEWFFSSGASLKQGSEIVIKRNTEDGEETYTATPIESFSINFAEFSEKTKDVQNTLEPENENAYKFIVDFLKTLISPMKDSVYLFSGSISDEMEKEFDKIDNEQTSSNKNITNNKNTVNDKTNEKNPKTGFELPIVLAGILVLLIGALFAVKKKNLFQNI